MTLKTHPFQFAQDVETQQEIKDYLTIFLEENGVDGFIDALGILVKKKGMTAVARSCGVSRQNLYQGLKEGGNPNFKTVSKVVNSLGCKLAIV